MSLKRAAVLAALVHFGPMAPAAAQDVTLTSRDGAVEVTGTLLGFDGEFYRVETRFVPGRARLGQNHADEMADRGRCPLKTGPIVLPTLAHRGHQDIVEAGLVRGDTSA